MDGKIVQISTGYDWIVALTDAGKLYTRVKYDRIIENGKDQYKEDTDWESGFQWKEIPLTETRETYQKSQTLPF